MWRRTCLCLLEHTFDIVGPSLLLLSDDLGLALKQSNHSSFFLNIKVSVVEYDLRLL